MSVGVEQRSAARVGAVLFDVVRRGQELVSGQAWGAPSALIQALPRQVNRLTGSRLFVGMLVENFPVLPGVTVETFFPSGPLGSVDGLKRHNATYERRSLYELARAFRNGAPHVDGVLAQAPEARGCVRSLGVTVDFVHAAAGGATTY